jgi:plastocyanin
VKFALASGLIVLGVAAGSWAGEIKGTVSVPPVKAADDKSKTKDASDEKSKSDEKAKPEEKRGVVVWVEGVKDVKVPDKKPALSQKDGQFAPRLMVVVAGQTVEIPNDDNIAHNVFSMSPTKKFNLGIYPKGESKEVTFEKPGIIDLFCSLHRHMHAQIIVTPSQHFAVAAPDEQFTIKDVPPGTYKVTAYSNGCAQSTMEVTVPDKGEAKAAFALKEAEKKQQQASAEQAR